MEFKIIKAFVISLVLMGCSEKEIKVKDDDSWIKIDKHHAFINIDTSDFNSKKTAELHYSGLEYYKMEKYKEAKQYFMKALELDDNNPVILNAIAGSECNLNNYKSASKYYGKAIESDSEFIQSYINFGRCYLTQKEYSKAIQILEQGKNNMISDSNMSKLDSLHNHSLFLNLGLSQEGMNNCKESFKNYRLSKSFACDNFSKKKVNYHVNKLKKSKKCH